LYHAVLQRILQAEHDAVATAQAALVRDAVSSEQVFAAVIRSHLEFLVARPTFLKLLAREALRGGAELRNTSASLVALTAGRALIEQEQAHGGIVIENPEHLLISLLALCWFPFTHAATVAPGLGIDPAQPDFCERYTAFIVRLLFDGIRARR
jgi:hypothetical protein